MNEEKMRILRLLEGGKVTSAEAMELIEVVGKSQPNSGGGGHGRALRIRVCESGAIEPRVNIRVPLGWAKFMAPLIDKIKAELAGQGFGVDLGAVQAAIVDQVPARMVDVQDGGERVEIFIE